MVSSNDSIHSKEPALIRKQFVSDLVERGFTETPTREWAPSTELSKAKVSIAHPAVTKSDARDKEAIQRLLTLPDGLRIYAFRYKNETEMRVGVMAQDLLAEPKRAGAVIVSRNRNLLVDYAKLGVLPATLEAWTTQGRRAISLPLE